MCALTVLCSAYCVVSIKQSQRLQTGLCLCDWNAIITSKWKGSYDSDRKYRSEWERLSCMKLPMDQYANCGTILPKWHHFFVTKDFVKPTADGRQFINKNSHHPQTTFKSILFGEAIRLRRLNQRKDDYLSSLNRLKEKAIHSKFPLNIN